MGYQYTIYIIPDVLALVVSLGLAFFIYIKNPSSRVNRLSSLFLFSFGIFAFGQVALSMSTDNGMAFIWARVKLLGLIFFAPLFLHTVLASADKGNVLLGRMRYLYLPSVFFVLILGTRLLIADVRLWRYGYDLELGQMGWAIIPLFLAYTSYAAYVLAKKYVASMETERLRTTPLLMGSLIIVMGFMGEAWRMVVSGDVYPFFPFAGAVVGVLFSYSVVKYDVLEVRPPPSPEDGKAGGAVPTVQAEVGGKEEGAAEPVVRVGVMALSHGVDKSRGAFLSLVSHGCCGLIVTKHSPEKVRVETGLKGVPIVALDVGGRGGALNPRKPENIFLTLQEFVDKGGECVILIEDLNYLLSVNPLETMRSFLVNSVELVSNTGGRLIMEMDEEKMNKDVLAELEHLVKYQYLMPVFTCLSNPIRKDILYYLEAGTASFTDIFKAAGVIFPSKVSFHLNSLKDAGLVEQDGARKYALTWKGETALQMVKDMEGVLTDKFKVE